MGVPNTSDEAWSLAGRALDCAGEQRRVRPHERARLRVLRAEILLVHGAVEPAEAELASAAALPSAGWPPAMFFRTPTQNGFFSNFI